MALNQNNLSPRLGGRPKFNIYWIWAIIAVSLLAWSVLGSGETAQKTNWDAVKEMIAKAKELLEWYNDLFLIQICLGGTADCTKLATLPSDFVMISPRDFKILVA